MHPASGLDRVGEHVPQRRPEAQGAVAAVDRRRGHATASQVTQHVRPGLGGLPVAVGDRDQLRGAIRADADDHQRAQPVVFEADVEVDAVDPPDT